MGRNRRKAGVGAVERIIYDIFGNVIGQEDDVAPTPTETITTISDPDFAHVDTTVFNPAAMSAPVQAFIKKQYDTFNTVINARAETKEYHKKKMASLGLDIDDVNDQRIYVDFKSGGSPSMDGEDTGTWTPTDQERAAMQERLRGIYPVPPRGPLSYHTDYRRILKVNETAINLINESFSVSELAPDGIGYAMIARQISAARIIAARTNKEVVIMTSALNDDDSQTQPNRMNGFYTWPKLGYEFDIPSSVKSALSDMGFTDAQMKDTTTLMQSRNPQGQLGFDVWRQALIDAGDQFLVAKGSTTIRPNASTPSPAEQVTIAYGKRKGYLKMQQRQRQNNDVFLSAEDDAILRDVWASMGRSE